MHSIFSIEYLPRLIPRRIPRRLLDESRSQPVADNCCRCILRLKTINDFELVLKNQLHTQFKARRKHMFAVKNMRGCNSNLECRVYWYCKKRTYATSSKRASTTFTRS